MESWEDEMLLDDDFSDEEEDAEEQIEETRLEMDADGFADWEDSSDTAPVDEPAKIPPALSGKFSRHHLLLSLRAARADLQPFSLQALFHPP